MGRAGRSDAVPSVRMDHRGPVEPPPTPWELPSREQLAALDSEDDLVAVGADLAPGRCLLPTGGGSSRCRSRPGSAAGAGDLADGGLVVPR